MHWSGNLAKNWRVFEEDFMDYAIATKLTGKDDTIQVATLKTLMGKECKQVLHRLELTEDQLKKMKTILENLKKHFSPECNVLYERYLFHSADQQPSETIYQYMLRQRHLAESCKFAALHDEMVRNQLVLGCKDKAARARLFREKECNLQRAVEALRISEATQEQLKSISGTEGI